MAVTTKVFSHFMEHMMNDKFVDLSGETAIKCSLHTNAYTPNQDTDDFWDDCTNEIAGAGYTHEGDIMTTTTVSLAGRVMTFDCDNPQWTAATFTARIAVFYDYSEAADGDKPLICYVDFGEDKVVEGGTFELLLNASGLFTATAAA